MADGDLTTERTEDGQWAVVRDGRRLSVHPREAGAEAARVRLAEAEQAGGDDAPSDYDPEEGPRPGNVGS